MMTIKVIPQSLVTLLYIHSIHAAYSLMDCYSSLPSDASDSTYSAYQSSAWCSSNCGDSNYFALSNGGECYCFDDSPDGNTLSSCTTSCFGYPQEMCGGSSSYSVYSNGTDDDDDDDDDDSSSSLSLADSDGSTTGTAASATTTVAATSSSLELQTQDQQSDTQTSTDTAQLTESSSPTTMITSTTTQDDTPSSSDVPTTTTSSSSSSSTLDPVTSIITHSANGVTSVVTITSTPTFDSRLSSNSSNKGAIIGGAVGGAVGGAALIVILVLLFWFFKRKNSSNDDDDSVDTYVDDAIYDEAIKRQTPQNPFDSPEDFNMNVDQRLNPIELGNRRLSEGSLADHADYTRKILRVANPDDNV